MENYYDQLYSNNPPEEPSRPKKRWFRLVLILVVAAALVILLVWIGRSVVRMAKGSIDVLFVSGTIQDVGSSDMFTTVTYDHQYLLNEIDRLAASSSNRALVVAVDSPGGAVYETDEVYLKLLDYKETTGRPIYASFGETAASGGYYLAMASDKIFCNRNCMTGSIGVTMGTHLDVRGFLDKLGIQSKTIASGPNKAMGSMYDELTQEQLDIYLSLVDDMYQQFVGIVDEGRPNLNRDQILELADGRVFSAKQALDAGLVDKIGTLDDAVAALKEDYGLQNCSLNYRAGPESSSWLLSGLSDLRPKNEVESVLELANQAAVWGYLCPELMAR